MTMMNELLNEPLIFSLSFQQLLALAFGVICLAFAVAGLFRKLEHKNEGLFYVCLCAAFAVWAVGVLGRRPSDAGTPFFDMVSNIGMALVPLMLLFHIWRQVYHKTIGIQRIVLYGLVPLLLSIYQIVYWRAPGILSGTVWEEINWFPIVLTVVSVCLYFRALLLCLNTFFQVPPHMRKYTWYLFGGVIFALGFSLVPLFGWAYASPIMMLLGLLTLSVLYKGFFAIRARDVIATSREFVFETLPTLVMVLSASDRILDWNYKGAARVIPFPAPGYMEPFENYKRRALAALQGHVATYSDDIVTVHHNGQQRHFQFSYHVISSHKKTYGQTVVVAEITGIYTIFRQLEDIALIDQLTGLGSRNGYLMRVKELVKPENLPLLIIVGDVNGLKVLNDSRGHLVGDALLEAVADCIKASLPEKAFAARIGGDEYVVLVPGGTAEMAEAFVRDTNTQCELKTDLLYGTPSISWGYSVMTSLADDYNTVFAQADKMMYEQKKASFMFRSSGIVPGI